MQAILSTTGQITLPESVRQQLHLHLQPGDAVEIIVGEQGEIKLLPVTSAITKLKGMLSAPPKSLTLSEIEDAITKGAVDL
ncbi:MAG: AbrB/MazE/SpoVT family DNA-binding domain-containing protein [Methylococcales bacterium]|nr:AbrB/MazE/SpoVT family DNA-binding domain-containing protein [Methylococcales bacterium]